MVGADPRERLVTLAAERGASLAALSAMLGRNPSYLQQFVRKGSPRKLEETDRRTLARFFDVPEFDLGAPDPSPAAYPPPLAPRGAAEWIDVPRLALGASAGQGAIAGEEVPIGHLRFSPRWLRDQGLEAERLSAIEVDGDSMEPTLRDGDEILVDQGFRSLRKGIYVIRLDGLLMVKRLKPGSGDTIDVISDNPSYASLVRQKADVEVIGRVVWKGGRL